jgi:hypothetical protein
MRTSDVSIAAIGRDEQPDGALALEYRWVSRAGDGAPVADHRLLLVARGWFVDSVQGPAALPPGASPLDAVCGWPARWTYETWPRVVRPGTPAGARLRVPAARAGLLLAERGMDAAGATVVEHDAVVLSGCPAEAQRLRGFPRAWRTAGAPALGPAPFDALS